MHMDISSLLSILEKKTWTLIKENLTFKKTPLYQYIIKTNSR